MTKLKPIKHGRSHYIQPLPDGSYLSWGWSYRGPMDAFRKAIRSSGVAVYAYVEAPLSQGSVRTPIFKETVVGQARLVTDAAKIGRKAMREQVMPLVRAAFASATKKAA